MSVEIVAWIAFVLAAFTFAAVGALVIGVCILVSKLRPKVEPYLKMLG